MGGIDLDREGLFEEGQGLGRRAEGRGSIRSGGEGDPGLDRQAVRLGPGRALAWAAR